MLNKLKNYEEFIWINPQYKTKDQSLKMLTDTDLTLEQVKEADERLRRFAPYFKAVFPDTEEAGGLIESPLISIEEYQKSLITFVGGRILGNWFMKADSHLPISGSIKARGGIYEVITYAEKLALSHQMINPDLGYAQFNTEKFKTFFAAYELVVGSTGNLGLSIGIIGKTLGFKVTVHMSKDAKDWKIEKLKAIGANVVLHEEDYSVAVAEGRKMALSDPNAYFIDDEDSKTLFLGYAVAALRLKTQFEEAKLIVDEDHPLFVYMPCGVGGAPGGITFGLKCLFGDHVHIFYGEPTHSPCMTLALAESDLQPRSIFELGLDNITDADGLAVSKASEYVVQTVKHMVSGTYTVSDEKLYRMLYLLAASHHMGLEPSALAGFIGPAKLFYDTEGFNYLKDHNLLQKMENATHLSWATGGNMVPDELMESYIAKGQNSSLMTF